MRIFDTKETVKRFLNLGTTSMLVLGMIVACFASACRPIIAEAAAAEANKAMEQATPSLLSFDGCAEGTVDGDRITVTDAKGAKHEFTWVDEGLRKTVDGAEEHSDPIPQGDYAAPAEVALHAVETAVTIWGDAVPACEIHINMYTGNGLELVYYGIGFGETPFESTEAIYGYADAVTGTILYLDNNYWGQREKQYGNEFLNEKVRAWKWDDAQYESVHTSEKALATAAELIRTCFPTGEIVPADPTVWSAGSHTDGEQIAWAGGYVALVDAYIRMDRDPCYYVQVAVPLEEGAQPCITIFGCYPLGWEYCCNQNHDPAVLREERADLGGTNTDGEAGEPTPVPPLAQDLTGVYADRAEALLGTVFTPMAEEWMQGDDPGEYAKIFLVRIGAYPDDGFESSEPMLDSAEVAASAKRGQVLCFKSNGECFYSVYAGEGQMIYADVASMTVCRAGVGEWMQDRTDCTCCILTWR